MEKPTLKINTDVDYYTMHEEIFARKMQLSKLHIFESHFTMGFPKGYKTGGDHFIKNIKGCLLSWSLYFFADNERGWLILTNLMAEQPKVDMVVEIKEMFDSIFKEAKLEIDFEVQSYSFTPDEADVMLKMDGTNFLVEIEDAFERAFSSIDIGRTAKFIETIGNYTSINNEESIREAWAELDQMYF